MTSLFAGDSHNVVKCSDGTVATWGENTVGQLGDGNDNDSSVPVAVSTSTFITGSSTTVPAPSPITKPSRALS